MEKDFKGQAALLNKYTESIADIKKFYMDGTSIFFAGTHGTGKQLSLETELPTPSGFIKLKDLKEGDELFDEEGNVCKVEQLHPINISTESYELEFDDGTKVQACKDHLWKTWSGRSRLNKYENKKTNNCATVKTTLDILNSLRKNKDQRANHSIENSKPIRYYQKELPIDPYVLGCWLGDGTSNEGSVESADQEILDGIKSAGYSINLKPSSVVHNSKSCSYRIGDIVNRIGELKLQLKDNKLLNNKHIPKEYLISSYEQRLSLLQGLLDTDGTCSKRGTIEYCTVLPELATQVQELVSSFGIKCKVKQNESWLYDKRCKDRYRIVFTTQLPVFRLSRKLKNIRLEKTQLSRTEHRFIVNIKKIDPIPMRCITVDSNSHLFLITRSFIPTHNTMVSTAILKKAAQKNYTCLYTTLSDSVAALTQAPDEEKYIARKELLTVDFLTIDEFDNRFMSTENSIELFGRTLENIFRTRSQNKMPTIMCTNSPNIVEAFSGSIKQSIDSLLKGYIKVVPILGADFRKEKGK